MKHSINSGKKMINKTENPELLSKTEKKIIKYKRMLRLGKITEDQIIHIFKKSCFYDIKRPSNIVLHELIGILDKIPFSEDQIIELINDERLSADEIANADIKLLTPKVQEELIVQDSYSSTSVLVKLYNEVPNSNIQLSLIFHYDASGIQYFPDDQKMNILSIFFDTFIEAFKSDPSCIQYFPDDQQMNIFNKFSDSFIEGFEIEPLHIQYLPEDQIINVMNKYPNLCIIGFEYDTDLIQYFPDDQKMDIVNKYSDSFAKGFENSPCAIRQFPDDQKMDIVNKYSDSFTKAFEDRPSIIEFFTEHQRMDIFNKYPDSLAKGFQNDPSPILYFNIYKRQKIKKALEKYNIDWEGN